ncbi:mitotic checkpoint regulator, MAD2B-interacting-domain-containing protein [Pisolithus albus]|nr:mitotic checkpoint regulator, MAD2B-interacting-domain-containing protein [Pisolithus albus]
MLGIEQYGSDVDSDDDSQQVSNQPPTKPPPPQPAHQTKKPRITSGSGQGAGMSSLLGMLPAPKQALPVKKEKKEERVLGGGGGPGLRRGSPAHTENEVGATDDTSTAFLPPSISKGKANVSLDTDGPRKITSMSKILSTPSGAYAPYDADYYASYARKWQAEYDKRIRELEKSQYNPQTDDMQDVDMAAEMEKARQEIQDADGEPEMPKMNVKGAKLGTVARARHQLTTLLTDAYLNREALEEKIAQARRNRKEAGNKYGACQIFRWMVNMLCYVFYARHCK